MRKVRIVLWVALGVAAGLGLVACGDGECGVEGENCSQAYKEANGVTYDCCAGLTCSENALGDLVCR